jgi:transposase
MGRRTRRSFTAEFKARAVELVRSSGKSVGQIAKDMDLTETSLREWVKQADAGTTVSGKIPEGEREELEQLRKEVRTLRMERDFLKKAAAFFAKETNK